MTPLRPRQFSSAARVYPSYLPHLRQTKRMPFRWYKPVAALLSAGIAYRLYYGGRATTTSSSSSSSSSSSWRNAHVAEVQAEERYDAERRRQNALMDQYGGRDSLEELEKAVQFYEKRD